MHTDDSLGELNSNMAQTKEMFVNREEISERERVVKKARVKGCGGGGDNGSQYPYVKLL